MSTGRGEVGAWLVLLAFVVVSRVAVAPEVLFEWDSANYALAIRDFDIYEHRPHPPGSPGFVLLLRLFSFLPGEIGPFVGVNALLGASTVAMLGLVLRRDLGPVAAWAVAAAFAVCPTFWQQGAISTAYVSECFCSLATLTASLLVARRKLSAEKGALLCAVVLSLRPSALVTLFPLAAAGALLARVSLVSAARALVVYGAVTAAWTAVSIVSGGGYARYRAASSALLEWQMWAGSAFAGHVDPTFERARILALYLVDAANLLLLVPLVVAWRRPAAGTVALWLAWTAPPASMYVFHHLAKSGYVLTLVPAVFVALALALRGATTVARRRASAGIAAAYVGWNTFAFAVAVPADALDWPDFEVPGPIVVTGDYGRLGLTWRTQATRRMIELVNGLDPERDLAVWTFGAFESHRLAMPYFPRHALLAVSLDHRASLLLPPGPDAPTTFGDLQVVLLRQAPIGESEGAPTRLELLGERTLQIVRYGRSISVDLRRRPDRVLVFTPCPPCEVQPGDGFRKVSEERLSWEVIVTELDGL